MNKCFVIIFTIMGGGLGYQWSKIAVPYFGILHNSKYVIGLQFLCGVIMMILVARLTSKGFMLLRQGEHKIASLPIAHVVTGTIGFIVGCMGYILLTPLLAQTQGIATLLTFTLSVVLGISGFRIGYAKGDELLSFFAKSHRLYLDKQTYPPYEENKILDTSVIIDGRIADICKTGFIEGTLIIPEFVLEELQHIADSSDLLKRNRGRRGLDVLNKIQKDLDVKVTIYEGDYDEITEVDSKLVRLAKSLQGKVITNDFNLNKVCELQGVSVLNINDLANAIKPVVLPGEEIFVQVIKDGKELGQGVAYLDDGTMIVVEGGREFIGSVLEVMVTSVLQTSAGRMIFAKPKLLEKAL